MYSVTVYISFLYSFLIALLIKEEKPISSASDVQKSVTKMKKKGFTL